MRAKASHILPEVPVFYPPLYTCGEPLPAVSCSLTVIAVLVPPSSRLLVFNYLRTPPAVSPQLRLRGLTFSQLLRDMTAISLA